jgi:hypothetical protein
VTQKKWIFFVAVLTISLILLMKLMMPAKNKVEINSISMAKEKINPSPQPEKADTKTDKREAGKASASSLNDMSQALHKFTKQGQRLKDLVQYLKDTHQDPQVSHDANPDTGEMAVVRTRRPLPGTRYFHAQYFSDGPGDEGFVQHMSFEVQPSATAMNDVVSAVSKSFGLQKPTVERDGYRKWVLDKGYILWVKRMENEDLSDDPFNAYSAADVGTIRVAVESNVHGEDE